MTPEERLERMRRIQRLRSMAAQNEYSSAKRVDQLRAQLPEDQQPKDERSLGQKVLDAGTAVSDFIGGKGITDQIGTQIAKIGQPADVQAQLQSQAPSATETLGSALQVGSLFTPVGTIAGGTARLLGQAGLKTGAKLAGNITAGATAGLAQDVGSDLQAGQEVSPGLGTALGAGIPVAGAAISKAATAAVPKLLSYTSNIPEEAFNQMLQRRQPVVEAIKAGTTGKDALVNTQEAVRGLRKTLSQEWKDATVKIADEFTAQRYSPNEKLITQLKTLEDEFGVELPQNVYEMSALEGINLLKSINELPTALLTLSPKGAIVRKTKDQLKTELVKSFGGDTGSIAQLYSNYATKKAVHDAANDIVKAYTTGKPIQQSTALGRLTALFSENKAAYLDAILDLEKTTGKDLMSKITAAQFESKLPSSTAAKTASGTLRETKGVFDKAFDLLLLPLTSPRSAGFIARQASKLGAPRLTSPGDMFIDGAKSVGSKIDTNATQPGFINLGGVSSGTKSSKPLKATNTSTSNKPIDKAAGSKPATAMSGGGKGDANGGNGFDGTLFHGTPNMFNGEPKYPLYLSSDKNYANTYTRPAASSLNSNKAAINPGVMEFNLNPKAKVLDLRTPEGKAALKDYWSTASVSGEQVPTKSGLPDWTEGEYIAQYLEDRGLKFDVVLLDEGSAPAFDGTRSRGVSYVALNKNAFTSKTQKKANNK